MGETYLNSYTNRSIITPVWIIQVTSHIMWQMQHEGANRILHTTFNSSQSSAGHISWINISHFPDDAYMRRKSIYLSCSTKVRSANISGHTITFAALNKHGNCDQGCESLNKCRLLVYESSFRVNKWTVINAVVYVFNDVTAVWIIDILLSTLMHNGASNGIYNPQKSLLIKMNVCVWLHVMCYNIKTNMIFHPWVSRDSSQSGAFMTE